MAKTPKTHSEPRFPAFMYKITGYVTIFSELIAPSGARRDPSAAGPLCLQEASGKICRAPSDGKRFFLFLPFALPAPSEKRTVRRTRLSQKLFSPPALTFSSAAIT